MRIQSVFLLLIISVVFSCKKDDLEPEDIPSNTDVVISEETRVLDAGIRAGIQSLDTISYTFQFSEGNAFAGDLSTGNVLVDDVSSLAPYGFLRKVTSVKNENGAIVVNTSQASLEDVIQQGSIDLHSASLKTKDIAQIYLAEGVSLSQSLKSSDLLGFDMNFEHPIDGNQEAIISGSLYFELDFNFDLDISLAGIDYFKTSVEVDEIASLGLDATSDVDLNEEITFARISFTPWTVMVGPVPIVFVPKVELILNSDLTITGSVQTLATQNYNREIGLQYDSNSEDGEDWSMINSTDPAPGYSVQPTALTDNAEFVLKVGPKASLKLYGIAGPYVDLLLVSDLEAEKSTNGFNLDYDLNLESNAGVEIDILFFELEKNYQLFDVNLAHQELNDEPLHQSFGIQSPVNGAKVNISETLDIQTYFTGLAPSEVSFYVDDALINTDTEEPFEYAWTVEGSEGLHNIKAIADYGDKTISSEVEVTFQLGGWSEIDVSSLFTTGYSLEYVRFSDTENGWILGHTKNYIPTELFCLHTSDGGQSWSKVYSGDAGSSFSIEDMEVLGSNTIYFIAGSDVWGSTNGGVSWSMEFLPSNQVVPDYISAERIEVNENGDVYALGQNTMYKLQSGGSGDWTVVEEFMNQSDFDVYSVMEMSFPIDNTGFFLGTSYNDDLEIFDSGLFTTTDEGAHWANLDIEYDQSEMDQIRYRDMLFIDNNTGWIIGETGSPGTHGFILKTIDGGATWSTQLLEKTPVDVYFLEQSSGYLSFMDYPNVNLGYTDDGGDTWHSFDTPFQDNTFSSGNIFFMDQNHGWFVNNSTLLRYALAGE